MIPTVEEIYRYLQTLAPLELQMDFDNSGMLIGHAENAVSRVLLALDITDEVVKEAVHQDYNPIRRSLFGEVPV